MTKVSRLNRRTVDADATATQFDARELIASLPHLPGVYRMFDAAGGALYVGKARDLQKRVASYFQKSGHEPRIAAMIAQVARVETTAVRSEGEALLLENNHIKALEPRYNILFRDDKSYPYICLSGRSISAAALPSRVARPQAPVFRSVPERGRGARRHGAAAEGVSAAHVREHGVRQPLAAVHAAPDPALHGAVRRADRARPTITEDVQAALLFLQGKTDEVLAQLKRQMDDAAAALQFERAARTRDKIARLQQLQSRQFVESATAGDIDVVAAVHEENMFAVNVGDDPRRPPRRRPHVLSAACRVG